MTQHAHQAGHRTADWRTAISATLHCLSGCAIGEILGMAIGATAGLSNGVTIALAVVLAFLFGYAFTARRVRRTGLPWRQAIRIAFAADTLSIGVMEVVDNSIVVAIPGAIDVGLTSVTFWLSLAAALAVAFVVTVPVNRWLIAKGQGHAIVPGHHHT